MMYEGCMQVDDMVKGARANGWAVGHGSVETLRAQVAARHWLVVPGRVGGRAEVEHLAPVEPAAAHARSLSAIHGRGEQPLHTDGAHHDEPPEFVVLGTPAGSEVRTHLLRLQDVSPTGVEWDALRHGIFSVSGGEGRFLAPCFANGMLRYDAACMDPLDSRADIVVGLWKRASARADRIRWTTSMLLVISNRQTLHARGDARHEPGRVMHRLAFTTKAKCRT
jgi:acyl dehydratase